MHAPQVHAALREVFTEIGREPVFPAMWSSLGIQMYGSQTDPSTIAGRIIERCTRAVNSCAHILLNPKLQRDRSLVLYHYVAAPGFWYGRTAHTQCPARHTAVSAPLTARHRVLLTSLPRGAVWRA